MAAGMAISEINTKRKIFVLISDGELHEGSVWSQFCLSHQKN